MNSNEDEAHLEEIPENDIYSRDTIPLVPPEREIHDEIELEGEDLLGDMLPIEPFTDVDIIPPEHEPEVNATIPPIVVSLTTKEKYKDGLKNMLKRYRKQKRTIGQLR